MWCKPKKTQTGRVSTAVVPLLASVLACSLVLIPQPSLAADNIGSLVNASFQTSWTYRDGGSPSAPGGWSMAGWAATSGGPQYYTSSAELYNGRPSDHRCKWEFSGGGAYSNNTIAKEVNWGSYTRANITVYCAGRTWGSVTGAMKLGADDNGSGSSWSDCSDSTSRTSNDESWSQLNLEVDKPGGATTFTVMLNAVPDGTQWNCQFDALAITGSNPCSATAPTDGWGTPNSTSQITWSWTVASGTGNVYRVYDAATGGTLKATSSADSTSVAESGLSVNTQYSRWVATYNVCESLTRLALPATYTFANIPSAPTVNGATSSSLDVTINENSNPASTLFVIRCVQGSTTSYVQTDGTLGTSEVFQTKANWGTNGKETVTGLESSTAYTFSVAAQNGDGVGHTDYSSGANGETTEDTGCGGDTAGSLINADFATSWTYRSGGVPSAPSGWTLGDWGATSGGPQYITTGNDCSSGRPSNHRCKFEMSGSGAYTDNMIYKEIKWGNYGKATVTVYCAQHSWSGGSGTASLGMSNSGCETAWADRTHTADNSGGECSWTQLSLTDIARSSGALSFTVMLNGNPNGTTWNCQFDKLEVTLGGGVGTLAGNVKDDSSVNIADATVSTNTGGYSTTTDSSGNYTISNVAAGTYNVTASKTGYVSDTENGKVVTAGQTTTVNFVCNVSAGNGTITGTVRNATMVGISGATVTTDPGSYNTTTDGNGDFTLSNVAAGVYDLTASKTSYQSHTWVNITVSGGATTTAPDYLLPRSWSKIGAHVTSGSRTGWGDFLDDTDTCGKPCQFVKCLDDFGASYDAKQTNSETLTMGRINETSNYDMQGFDAYADPNSPAYEEPEDFAQIIFDEVQPIWDQNTHIDVWEINNEWSWHWAWQADFSIAMMDIAEAEGYRIGLFGCSGGNPPEAYWPDIARACARAKSSGGHLLSLHEYSWDTTLEEDYDIQGNLLVTRYRRLYEYLQDHNADCFLTLTEVGNHGGGGFIGDAAFVADMGWYDDECRLDSYVLGIASWTLGNWGGANWQTALPEMADYICDN